jgi:hypothetical protein
MEGITSWRYGAMAGVVYAVRADSTGAPQKTLARPRPPPAGGYVLRWSLAHPPVAPSRLSTRRTFSVLARCAR